MKTKYPRFDFPPEVAIPLLSDLPFSLEQEVVATLVAEPLVAAVAAQEDGALVAIAGKGTRPGMLNWFLLKGSPVILP